MMNFYSGVAKLTFLLTLTLLHAWKIARNRKRAIKEMKEENKEKKQIDAKERAVNERELTKHQNYLELKLMSLMTKNRQMQLKTYKK